MKLKRLFLICTLAFAVWISTCAFGPVPQSTWHISNQSSIWLLVNNQHGLKPIDPWREIAEEMKKLGWRRGMSPEKIQVRMELMYYDNWFDNDVRLARHALYNENLFRFIHGKGLSELFAGEPKPRLDLNVIAMFASTINCSEPECLHLYELIVAALNLNRGMPVQVAAKALYLQHQTLYGWHVPNRSNPAESAAPLPTALADTEAEDEMATPSETFESDIPKARSVPELAISSEVADLELPKDGLLASAEPPKIAETNNGPANAALLGSPRIKDPIRPYGGGMGAPPSVEQPPAYAAYPRYVEPGYLGPGYRGTISLSPR